MTKYGLLSANLGRMCENVSRFNFIFIFTWEFYHTKNL